MSENPSISLSSVPSLNYSESYAHPPRSAAPLRALLHTPTPALSATQPCSPDDDGVRWRSHISPLLEQRARERGVPEQVVLIAFLGAMGVPPLMAARIEAGRAVPTRDYRERAACVLDVPVEQLFERIPATARARAVV